MSTGFSLWNSSRWCAKTVALEKNSASERERAAIWMSSVFVPRRTLAPRPRMRASVSPPLGRKRILPRDTAEFFFTKPRCGSSVQIVTIQPSCSAMPLARATKGCTSPRVPRVIMKTWQGYSCAAKASAKGSRATPGAGQDAGIDALTMDISRWHGLKGATVASTASPDALDSIQWPLSGLLRRSTRGTVHSPMDWFKWIRLLSYNVTRTVVLATSHSAGSTLLAASSFPFLLVHLTLPTIRGQQCAMVSLPDGRLRTWFHFGFLDLGTMCDLAAAMQPPCLSSTSTTTMASHSPSSSSLFSLGLPRRAARAAAPTARPAMAPTGPPTARPAPAPIRVTPVPTWPTYPDDRAPASGTLKACCSRRPRACGTSRPWSAPRASRA
mmetsp:Transcript_57915/g.164569  ORF Transcript_57915/g.164569 Transcript_57915/m.164569 type:complete len:383 (-) Transcript_57915:214-1362(-)